MIEFSRGPRGAGRGYGARAFGSAAVVTPRARAYVPDQSGCAILSAFSLCGPMAGCVYVQAQYSREYKYCGYYCRSAVLCPYGLGRIVPYTGSPSQVQSVILLAPGASVTPSLA